MLTPYSSTFPTGIYIRVWLMSDSPGESDQPLVNPLSFRLRRPNTSATAVQIPPENSSATANLHFYRSMKPPRMLTSGPTNTMFIRTTKLAPNVTRVLEFRPPGVKFPATVTTILRPDTATLVRSLSPAVAPDTGSGPARGLPGKLEGFEEHIEKVWILGSVWIGLLAICLNRNAEKLNCIAKSSMNI